MGIQAKNRTEWALTHIANMFQKATTIAFYDTLGPDATKYIIDQTKVTTMSVSSDYVKILSKLKVEDTESGTNLMESLVNLVSFEKDVSDDDKALAEKAGITVHYYADVLAKGKEIKAAGKAEYALPEPEDVYMLSYTSGTTGNPKGVKLTHKMIIGAGFAVNSRLKKQQFTTNDTYISYLPFSHSFEQAVFGISLIYGMKCGFFGGNTLKLTEDMQILKPTFFPSVPRLFNKIFGTIQGKLAAATGIKKKLVDKAVSSKMANLHAGKGVTHALFDALVFKKMKAILGGKVRMMITGSAPIAGEVLDFLKICFCSPICEGYGMTETCAGSVTTFPDDPVTGIVGGPLQNVKLRLRDIPEMNYLHTSDPPKGEVVFWGPSIMKGYFANEEKTAEAMHGEWLLSGDVAVVFPNGSIKIVDRAKNIFKLSQGEYIAPEKLENVYIQSSYVAQVWCYGDSLRDFVLAFVVVEPSAAKKYCESHEGLEFNDDLMNNDDFKMTVLKDLMNFANENKFNGLEKPKQIHLVKDAWTVESNLLTPTMKMKRNIAKDEFKDQIEAMYSAGPIRVPK